MAMVVNGIACLAASQPGSSTPIASASRRSSARRWKRSGRPDDRSSQGSFWWLFCGCPCKKSPILLWDLRAPDFWKLPYTSIYLHTYISIYTKREREREWERTLSIYVYVKLYVTTYTYDKLYIHIHILQYTVYSVYIYMYMRFWGGEGLASSSTYCFAVFLPPRLNYQVIASICRWTEYLRSCQKVFPRSSFYNLPK